MGHPININENYSLANSETVVVHNKMPSIVRTQYFLEEQVYPVKASIIHQDKQGAILLETKCCTSSSRQIWHMNVSYFCGRLSELSTHCGEVLPNWWDDWGLLYQTIDGTKFWHFWKIIINCNCNDSGTVDIDSIMMAHNDNITRYSQANNNEHAISEISSTPGS